MSILHNTETNGMKTNVILENEKYVFKTLNLVRLHLAKNFVYITAICILFVLPLNIYYAKDVVLRKQHSSIGFDIRQKWYGYKIIKLKMQNSEKKKFWRGQRVTKTIELASLKNVKQNLRQNTLCYSSILASRRMTELLMTSVRNC